MNKRLFFGNEEQFKKALATVEEHKQKFYLLIVDKAAKSFVDFQSLTIATKLNGDSIFASLRNKYIEIDYDEDLLVLDASGSFDARGDVTKLKYTWRNNVNNVVFYDKQKLVLTPF